MGLPIGQPLSKMRLGGMHAQVLRALWLPQRRISITMHRARRPVSTSQKRKGFSLWQKYRLPFCRLTF